jgi:hypothetical protein
MAAIVGTAASGSGEGGSPGPVSPYPPVRLDSRPSPLCNFDRIMLAPDGDRVVAWSGSKNHILATQVPPPFGNLTVTAFPGKAAAATPPPKSYYGPDLVLPVRWDGELLWARATRNRMLAIDIGQDKVEERGVLPAAFDRIDLRATTDGDLSALQEPVVRNAVSRVGGDFYRAGITLGRQPSLFGVRTGNLSLVRLGASDGPPLLRASFTRRLLAFPDTRHFEGGLTYAGAPDRASGNYLPYQLPIVDLATGEVVGKFNGAEVRLDATAPIALASLRRTLAAGGAILDASYRNGRLAVLARVEEGRIAALRVGPTGLSRIDLCTDSPPAAPTPRLSIFGIDRSGREVMRPGVPIAIHLTRPTGRGRDLVIVFDGGPTGSLSDNYLPPVAGRLMGKDRDLLVVDYAGSVGGGPQLTSRLTTGGLAAIAEDVDALLAWLKAHPYRRVYLDGGSFGAIPAMLALKRDRKRFAAAIFTVPLLKLRDPTEWTQRRPFGTISAPGQLAFEEAVFGGADGRARFALDLSRLVASTPFGEQDAFFFGQADFTSQAQDLPKEIRSRIATLKAGHHESLGVRADYLREVESILAKR